MYEQMEKTDNKYAAIDIEDLEMTSLEIWIQSDWQTGFRRNGFVLLLRVKMTWKEKEQRRIITTVRERCYGLLCGFLSLCLWNKTTRKKKGDK
jgi:hypothetical protein